MEKTIVKSLKIKKLKGLFDVEFSFSDTLTAIMGVNGSGKSTVIHALSCLYQPDGNGEDHRFPEFFVPNSDSLWNGSKLYAINENEDSSGNRVQQLPRCYSKDNDRWKPRYKSRPKRNVYYIGIDSCLPDIEKKTRNSMISYSSTKLTDRIPSRVTQLSSSILNKDYEYLYENIHKNKHFPGVELSSGIKYSSLSMGSEEQRVIKIINVLLNAEPYSLVLIDEIDLLLHVTSLKKLIMTLHGIAVKKHGYSSKIVGNCICVFLSKCDFCVTKCQGYYAH